MKFEIGNLNPIKSDLKFIFAYSLLAILIWYITPQTGGGRFVLPYLPALSITIAAVFIYPYPAWFRKILVGLVFCIAFITILYRGYANAKYIPVIIGTQTKASFLAKHLHFDFGDFYDTDGYLASHINHTDIVLLYGLHNLYYIDFLFIDNSWIKKGDRFNYILVQEGDIPKRFAYWHLVYQNPLTHVKLYSLGGHMWY